MGEIVTNKRYKKAQIVTTAHPKLEMSQWATVTKCQLEDMGLNVSYTDFLQDGKIDNDTDIVYVCGGNTFRLLYSIQNSQHTIIDSLEKLFNRGGIYVGSSAGAVIASPDIRIAEEIGGDKNTIGVHDYTGLNFTDKYILPHYQPKLDPEIALFTKRYNLAKDTVIPLADGEGIYIYKGKIQYIKNS